MSRRKFYRQEYSSQKYMELVDIFKLDSLQFQFLLKMSEAVKVMVRCRPMNTKQKERNCISILEVDMQNHQVHLIKQDNKQQPKSFSFDYVFAADCPQNLIYQQSAFSLVDNVLDGYNGTIFAYGQTGCGKTHTMMGTNENEQSKGIIPRTFSQIITITKNDTAKHHLIRCSFLQIYNQQIHDLLSKDTKAKMQLKESPEKGVFVKDISQIEVDSSQKMQKYMEIGFKSRAVRATNMNAQSSRSHSIFTIYIDSQQSDEKGNQKYKASKLNLVDLAGSERISKTGTTGEGMKEATKINLSLSALGNVISALVDGKMHHIPYRDSKLTRLLQDSLGGNTKTIMIAAVSPANYNYDETLSTLRYASRAKNIQNKPKINEDPKDALLKEYMQQIKRLKMMLQGKTPMDMTALALFSASNNQDAPKVIIKERIVYKQNGQNETSNELEQQLKNKQHQLRTEQQQKRLLQQKLQNLEKHFSHQKPAIEDTTELEKMKKLKEKLKAQKKKEEEYLKEKERRQMELLSIQKNYKSLNQQVDEMKIRFKQIKNKYIANLQEIKDIQNEHEDQKERLLDTIREQQKEIKKFSTILNVLMNQEQIDYIVNNSDWSQEKRQWTVPNFTYKEKSMGLPKLNSNSMNKKQANSTELDSKKEVSFKANSMRDTQKTNVREGNFRVNNIVRNARQNDQAFNNPHSLKSATTVNKQLTPLKTDTYQKSRAELVFQTVGEKKKIQKLNPLNNGHQSKKYF